MNPGSRRDEQAAVDPDLDAPGSPAAGKANPRRWTVPVIALGGMAGASARYAVDVLAGPDGAGAVPWSTLVINVSGCLLFGVLMGLLSAGVWAHPLARPFLGVGVLGGYTTFGSVSVQAHTLVAQDRPGVAFGYVLATLVASLAAVAAGGWAASALLGRPGRSSP